MEGGNSELKVLLKGNHWCKVKLNPFFNN